MICSHCGAAIDLEDVGYRGHDGHVWCDICAHEENDRDDDSETADRIEKNEDVRR